MKSRLQKPRYANTGEVECPFCKAKPGQPCMPVGFSLERGPLDYYHLPRRQAANDTRLKIQLGTFLDWKRSS